MTISGSIRHGEDLGQSCIPIRPYFCALGGTAEAIPPSKVRMAYCSSLTKKYLDTINRPTRAMSNGSGRVAGPVLGSMQLPHDSAVSGLDFPLPPSYEPAASPWETVIRSCSAGLSEPTCQQCRQSGFHPPRFTDLFDRRLGVIFLGVQHGSKF